MPRYLKQRGHSWYVQLAVPLALQPQYGQKVITRALHTRDLSLAELLKHEVIASLQRQFSEDAASAPKGTAEALLAFAQRQRAAIENGEDDPENALTAFDETATRYLDKAAKVHGRDSEGHPKLPAKEAAVIRRAYSAISGNLSRSLEVKLGEYLGEQEESVTGAHLADKRRWLSGFIDWFGPERDCASVTRADLGQYTSEVVQTRKRSKGNTSAALSPRTRQKEIGAIHSFFDWLAARGIIEVSPAAGLPATIRTSSRGKAKARRPWTPDELAALLKSLPKDDPLFPLVAIGAYSGMRREEVAALKASDIDGQFFRITQGKTAAAVRRVPIHPAIAPMVASLSAKPDKAGFLIPGLLTSGKDDKRGVLIGKRFGVALKSAGLARIGLDFHAFRYTVITQMEGAGVPESTIRLIVGHSRQGVTFGTYSAGVPDKVLTEALAHVTYGRKVDGSITRASVTVKRFAKRRKRSS